MATYNTIFKKDLYRNTYEINTQSCICGSSNIVYEIKQIVRQQGVSERKLVETILKEELIRCYCPECKNDFSFEYAGPIEEPEE